MKSDVRTFDLNLLGTLDALLGKRSITRAAQRLSLAQPAVSGVLSHLRDYFDDPLFSRTPHGIVPTPCAQQLAAPVRQILSNIDILLRPTQFDPFTAALTFTVAVTDYTLRAVIVPFIATFRVYASGTRMRVIPIGPMLFATQFEREKIDLALPTPDSTSDNLHSQALYDEEYICLIRRAHPGTG